MDEGRKGQVSRELTLQTPGLRGELLRRPRSRGLSPSGNCEAVRQHPGRL